MVTLNTITLVINGICINRMGSKCSFSQRLERRVGVCSLLLLLSCLYGISTTSPFLHLSASSDWLWNRTCSLCPRMSAESQIGREIRPFCPWQKLRRHPDSTSFKCRDCIFREDTAHPYDARHRSPPRRMWSCSYAGPHSYRVSCCKQLHILVCLWGDNHGVRWETFFCMASSSQWN